MDEHQNTLLSKITAGLVAAVIGGSLTTIVDNKITNIRQEEQIIQIAELKQRVESLNQGLNEANTHLALFNLQFNQLKGIAQENQKGNQND